MNFEEMFKMFQMMQAMSTVMQNWMKPETREEQKPEKKPEQKKKEDMTAKERLDALEEMYAKQDEEDVLMKRIEALEKRAPKVTTEIPEPMGLDGILKGMIPGMMNGQPKGGKE